MTQPAQDQPAPPTTPPPTPHTEPSPATAGSPTIIRVFVVFAGLAAAGVGITGLLMGLTAISVTLWNVVNFSALTLAAGVFVVLIGAGRFPSGRAITLLIAGGIVGSGVILGFIEASPNLSTEPTWRRVAGFWRLAGVGVGGTLIALAAIDVLSRRPRASFAMIRRAATAAMPLALLLAAAYWMYRTPSGRGMGDSVQIAFAVFGGAGVIASIAITGHYLIKAFEASGEQHGTVPGAP